MKRLVRLSLCVWAASLLPGAAVATELSVSQARSSDGVYQLHWSAQGPVVLEESRTADFARPRAVYRGTDRATILTGRSDGTYFYRLRGTDAKPVDVTVEHHSLLRALGFFTMGGIVFVATVALVVGGSRAEARRG